MNDIFEIPINQGNTVYMSIIYAPRKGYSKIVRNEQEKENAIAEARYLSDKPIYHISPNPSDFRTLMILPNNKCNFHCAYCYSAKGRNNTEITSNMLNSILEWFISPYRLPEKKLTLIYIGGGEPLLSWSTVKESILYAKKLNDKRDGEIYISIVTNCSIINEDIINLCLDTDTGICASYDILEDVQNKLRGHYNDVTSNINYYSSRGVDVGITTVITEDNIQRMSDMINIMNQTIPNVKQVSFKPLIPNHSFKKFSSKKDYYTVFVDNFFDAKVLADKYGIRLTCPYLNAVSVLQDRFCEGKFVIAADGTITGCNFVSSPLEDHFDEFVVGFADEHSINIDKEGVQRVFSHNNSINMCPTCPAKYHCAGGCYADHIYLSKHDKETYCNAMKYFLTTYLKKKLLPND